MQMQTIIDTWYFADTSHEHKMKVLAPEYAKTQIVHENTS